MDKESFDSLWDRRPIPKWNIKKSLIGKIKSFLFHDYNYGFDNGYARAFADIKEELVKEGIYPPRDKQNEE